MPRTKSKDMFETQPYRVRNILTLEERVRAIQAYDLRPMYTKIAKTFNCSWEQIKNIVANRDAIMSFYEATKNTERNIDASRDDLRQRKINFLGECMYEYIQRIQFHTKVDITEELIRMKAFEFLEIMEIEKFTPNRAWINHFKATYNFSLSNRQIKLTRTPPSSLDLKDIMTYCTKNQTTLDKLANQEVDKNYFDPLLKIKIDNLKRRRIRKLQFMERALLEYMQRAQYHKKMEITEVIVRKLARDLKDVLKIDNFQPNGAWFTEFRKRFSFYFGVEQSAFKRAPPFSLDLKVILSYCSRMDPKNQTHITLTPKSVTASGETAKIRVRTPALVQAALQHMQNKRSEIKAETSDFVERTPTSESEEVEDLKPDIHDLNAGLTVVANKSSDGNCEHSPLKIQKVETCLDEGFNAASWLDATSDIELDPLNISVTSSKQALRLLKPLEEFALLEQNYRAIGLITQLEDIFKNFEK